MGVRAGRVVGMNLSARIGRATIAAFLLGCTSIGAGQALAAETTTIAQAADTAAVTDRVNDEAGVLSTEEIREINEKITQLQKDQSLIIFVVFANDLGTDPESYARNIVNEKGGILRPMSLV